MAVLQEIVTILSIRVHLYICMIARKHECMCAIQRGPLRVYLRVIIKIAENLHGVINPGQYQRSAITFVGYNFQLGQACLRNHYLKLTSGRYRLGVIRPNKHLCRSALEGLFSIRAVRSVEKRFSTVANCLSVKIYIIRWSIGYMEQTLSPKRWKNSRSRRIEELSSQQIGMKFSIEHPRFFFYWQLG